MLTEQPVMFVQVTTLSAVTSDMLPLSDYNIRKESTLRADLEAHELLSVKRLVCLFR